MYRADASSINRKPKESFDHRCPMNLPEIFIILIAESLVNKTRCTERAESDFGEASYCKLSGKNICFSNPVKLSVSRHCQKHSYKN